MNRRLPRLAGVLLGTALLVACSGPEAVRGDADVAPTPRRMVVWLDGSGVDAETSSRLAAVGVDELVVRRGTVRLSAGAPVIQLLPPPPVEGPIPTAVALEIRGLGVDEVGDHAAEAVWAALAADFGGDLPTELVLDLPEVGDGTAGFLASLARHSGLAVTPVLSVAQIETEAGRAAAASVHGCIVPVFGSQQADLRGVGGVGTPRLAASLAPLRDLGVRVRLAAALRPKVEPDVGGWAADIEPLTDESTAEIQRTSTLDRSFLTLRPVTWAGRSFGARQTIAVAWVDTARLGTFLTESHRLVLPDMEGWDLVTLPPSGPNLGLDREELIRYLGGDGPAPSIEARVRRSGRELTVRFANPSVFRSTITGFGNWVQIELAAGSLVASSRGDFDRVILGAVRDGEWQPNPPGGPNAVRFVDNYVGPGEELETGTVRLPSSRSEVTVRWQVRLSDGSTVTGVAR